MFLIEVLQSVREFTTNSSCKISESELCRDESTALILKFVAMASILVAGFSGIAIPLLGNRRGLLRADGEILPAAKAFAAGVILATGFVHMLKDAWEALNHSCLKSYSHVWSKFPFAGFFAMMAALFTLLVDFVGTQYYARKQGVTRGGVAAKHGEVIVNELEEELLGEGIVEVKEESSSGGGGGGGGGGIHIVGMHAHASNHGHSHQNHHLDDEIQHGHGNGHSHDEVEGSIRHVVISQVTTIFSTFILALLARHVTA